MTAGDKQYHRAVARIDAANAPDPNELVVRGRSRPKALGEAELATEWLHHLKPDASEALRLATRAHHVRRWEVPRSSYPDGRAGYLRWRRDLHERHGSLVAELLEVEGYDAATVSRVKDIVQKRDLSRDPEVQAFEDVLCLVFLETQFAELAARLDEAKMVDVLRKTLVKMSDAGKAAAASISLGGAEAALLEKALAHETPGG